jgi:sugar lactone lactonase YvrE
MMRTKRTGLMAVLLAAVVAVAGGVTTEAKPGKHGKGKGKKTRVYTLPSNAGNPEGVAFDKRSGAFYVTEAAPGSDGVGGRVWRGTLDDPTLEEFLPASGTRPATIGTKVRRGRLYLAGGPAGDVEIYSIASRQLVRQFQLCSGCFVNDLTVAKNGDVYATESQQSQFVYRIPADAVKNGGAVDPIPIAPPVVPAGSPNVNGIAASKSGRYVIFVQSSQGKLFRLDTRTRQVHEIAVRGGELTNGDGIVLNGNTLYVVRNRDQLIAEVKLNRRFRRARVVGTTSDPTFEDPTTAALARRGRLLVVNSDFFDPKQGPPFTVSSIKKP